MPKPISKVVIFQYRLLHYRTALFEQLRKACGDRGIDLHVVCGQPTRRELPKKDEGHLPWSVKVKNLVWEVGTRDLIWQPFPYFLRDADLVIVMQESRLISTYPILMSRLWNTRKVAYWGHGRNFQSLAPSGVREKWKRFLLTRIDWWFAYTELTVGIVRSAGYPQERITCLDNAIDTNAFRRDLSSWTTSEVVSERKRLGIGETDPVGVYCGSLYPDKKLSLLVDSADLIRQKIPNYSLIVMGDGPSMPQMKMAAASRPWIHLVGVRTGREKALYFRMGDVMLNPGALGLHIVDAFCSGLVMITIPGARHGPEVVYLRDGENGVLSAGTAEAFSQAVRGVIENPIRLASMKQAALAASERYTIENMVGKFVDGIEAALNA